MHGLYKARFESVQYREMLCHFQGVLSASGEGWIAWNEDNEYIGSSKKFKELFPDKVKLRIRFSLDNLKLDDDMLNIPLFMADQTDRLIGQALEQRIV